MCRNGMWLKTAAAVLCAGMAAGSVMAGEKCEGEGQNRGMKMGHRGKGVASEAIKEERERFRDVMKEIQTEIKALREEAKDAVKESHEGEGKPTKEMLEQALEPFRDDAQELADRVWDERIKHHENIAAILTSEKSENSEKLAKVLLMPGRGKSGKMGRVRGKDDEEKGGKEGSRNKRRRRDDHDEDTGGLDSLIED